ncbi:alpha/beta hydrolase [Pseudomonas putida]|uniref:alpha/beta fold hydrolase n=1 Tax=Pseudomonas putida TaxID=303 RepID=UPI002363200E|nr:alpha/beta hydrolase [Pseudomonas putida]MDD1963866.1 alpha/beta hydrolase [Pseudomonas putida]
MLVDTPESGPINVIRTGPRTRKTLLFLHPVGLDSTWFDNQISVFAQEYDVVAIDMPGHGLSSPLVSEPSFAQLADTVSTVLNKLDIRQAHVVGLSFGGMIAQHLALRHPEVVRSLVLVGTTHTAVSARTALKQRAAYALSEGMASIVGMTIERWFAPGYGIRRPDVLDRATATLLRQDAFAHGAIWGMVSDLDLTQDIDKISCPALVVGGSADINVPYEIIEALARALGGAPIEMLEGVGHFPPIESPNAFNGILHSFLKQL